jgi:hypothetical protein
VDSSRDAFSAFLNIVPLLQYVGVQIAWDFAFLTKICRIRKVQLTVRVQKLHTISLSSSLSKPFSPNRSSQTMSSLQGLGVCKNSYSPQSLPNNQTLSALWKPGWVSFVTWTSRPSGLSMVNGSKVSTKSILRCASLLWKPVKKQRVSWMVIMYLLIIQFFLYMYLPFAKKLSLHTYQKKKGSLSQGPAQVSLHDKYGCGLS